VYELYFQARAGVLPEHCKADEVLIANLGEIDRIYRAFERDMSAKLTGNQVARLLLPALTHQGV